MENKVTGKVNGFIKKHKTIIISGGLVISYFVIRAIQKQAFIAGGRIGFHETINWFDGEFEDLNLRERYNEYAETNPDKMK